MVDAFQHTELKLVEPPYDSPLTRVVMELQYLRRQRLGGSTPPPIFFQLKTFFHLLESIASARIEGNRTTLVEAVDASLSEGEEQRDEIREISNLESAMSFIEEHIKPEADITSGFALELHKRVVAGLAREGDSTPGQYRKGNVAITNSRHRPPDGAVLQDYLKEFFDFINMPPDPAFDLLRIAIAHHRFAWIHPFNNGNGRVVRLLTYALLVAKGFDVGSGRIINPSAVFCRDRKLYYAKLKRADEGTESGMLEWCHYVLNGLSEELQKIDKLLEYGFLSQRILLPAVAYSLERKLITETEAKILCVAIEKVVFQAGDIEHLAPGKVPAERSRTLKGMRENHLIEPVGENARKYVIRFSRSLLTRGLIHSLILENFITAD